MRPDRHFPVKLLDVAQFSTSAVKARRQQSQRRSLMAGVSLYGFLDETGDVRKDERVFMCGYVG
jgi:hypothetical protein